jgi:hypothetical protein
MKNENSENDSSKPKYYLTFNGAQPVDPAFIERVLKLYEEKQALRRKNFWKFWK